MDVAGCATTLYKGEVDTPVNALRKKRKKIELNVVELAQTLEVVKSDKIVYLEGEDHCGMKNRKWLTTMNFCMRTRWRRSSEKLLRFWVTQSSNHG